MSGKQLLNPMTDTDFMQLVLVANSIAIFKVAIGTEKQGSKRRSDYADILMRLKRVERTIPGHLEGRVLDASKDFYAELEAAVVKFGKTFKESKA